MDEWNEDAFDDDLEEAYDDEDDSFQEQARRLIRDFYRTGYIPRYTPRKPRQAEGGIAARSQRGAIGETWWSKRFISALERFTQSSRITRGKSYARRGQVMDLEVASGQVNALVQGTRRRPYEVAIKIHPFDEESWGRIEAALAERALYLAALLNGEMPPEIDELFGSLGLSLFPESAREVRTDCSCPDYANPCKHIAAVYYILAEAFDSDPFLALTLRGRDREDLLGRLRTLRMGEEDSGRGAADLTATGDRRGRKQRAEGPEPVEYLGDLAGDWWDSPEPVPQGRGMPEVPAQPALILREMGPFPFKVRRETLPEWLSGAYAAFTEGVFSRLVDPVDPVPAPDPRDPSSAQAGSTKSG